MLKFNSFDRESFLCQEVQKYFTSTHGLIMGYVNILHSRKMPQRGTTGVSQQQRQNEHICKGDQGKAVLTCTTTMAHLHEGCYINSSPETSSEASWQDKFQRPNYVQLSSPSKTAGL